MSLIPLRSYTHFVAMREHFFSHRGHVCPFVFLEVHPQRIHTSHVPCAFFIFSIEVTRVASIHRARNSRVHTFWYTSAALPFIYESTGVHTSRVLQLAGIFQTSRHCSCSKHIWVVVLLLRRLGFEIRQFGCNENKHISFHLWLPYALRALEDVTAYLLR